MQSLMVLGMTRFQSFKSYWRRLLLHLMRSPLLILVALWIYLVYRNERLIFSRSVSQCDWNRWEDWPSSSNPHRLVLIADPQLVDPHTYPGRPWPLSSLTIKYTDLYLKRVHRLIQQRLLPDSTIFLGDLFDGGREWATGQSSSPEKRYRRYGESFWHKEYRRFSTIFYDTWQEAGVMSSTGTPPRRRIMTNIPGNHDLGFATGIQEPVRKRFNAYFGEGNELWLIGNHTVVSLDTVSLSAKEDSSASESIWRPSQQFLDDYDTLLRRASALQFSSVNEKRSSSLLPHTVVEGPDLRKSTFHREEQRPTVILPTVLLSHVPLYREEGTPCGPLRERWPPSTDPNGRLLDRDERNAIRIARGYQYQNVLSPIISHEITSKLKHVSLTFSGDDHDHCDVLHHSYPSAGAGIREITVKSISWAMGVRKPGIQLVSLWNPLASQTSAAQQTFQTQLCFLPDQLSLFMQYLLMLGFTLSVLVVRALCLTRNTSASSAITDNSLLPIVHFTVPQAASQGQSSSSDDGVETLMTKRSRLGISTLHENERRSPSPKPSYGYGLPAISPSQHEDVRNGKTRPYHFSPQAPHAFAITAFSQSIFHTPTAFITFKRELAISAFKILALVVPWYIWLLSND